MMPGGGMSRKDAQGLLEVIRAFNDPGVEKGLAYYVEHATEAEKVIEQAKIDKAEAERLAKANAAERWALDKISGKLKEQAEAQIQRALSLGEDETKLVVSNQKLAADRQTFDVEKKTAENMYAERLEALQNSEKVASGRMEEATKKTALAQTKMNEALVIKTEAEKVIAGIRAQLST